MIQEGLDFYRSERCVVSSSVDKTTRRVLRPYQKAAIEGVWGTLGDNRSTLFVMPTGTGKTIVFAQLAKGWPGHKSMDLSERVLILANRDELLQQARKKVSDETGEQVGLEQAQFFGGTERIVVASVQTLCMPDRLARWAPDHFGLIICDEADLSITVTWDRMLDHFSKAKIVGCTATPDRADGKALGRRYLSRAFVYEIQDAIRDKWLCPLTYEVVRIQDIDISAVRDSGKDLNQEELDAAMVEKALYGIAKETLERSGDRRTLGFTTSVDKAVRLAEISNQLRPGCARAVSHETPLDERRAILRGHQMGDYQYLWNMGIVSRGYDDPEISCIAQGRPTKSRNLFAQMIGRGLRPKPSSEDSLGNLLVLEFTGNHGRHELACSMDILAGRYTDDVVKRAKRLVEQKPMPAQEALALANAEAEAFRLKELARRARLQVEVQSSSYQYNPFDLLHLKKDSVDEWEDQFGGASASPKQIAYLRKTGLDIPENLTARQAKKLQGACWVRRQKGLASPKQVRVLTKHGIPGINISFAHASEMIGDIIAGRRPRGQRDRIPGEDDDQ